MKPPEGFSEKVRARIIEISGQDPGPFTVRDYVPGTREGVTEAEVIEAMAKSMVRIRPDELRA